jgi:hypothetical protein
MCADCGPVKTKIISLKPNKSSAEVAAYVEGRSSILLRMDLRPGDPGER